MPILTTLGAACARAWGFTSGLVKDQYFNLVSLLLPGNGTDGKQNRTFLDSSGQNGGAGWTITPNGNATQGTFSPFSQTGWGNYFDGSGDYLTATNSSAFYLSTGNFTVEAWIYRPASGSGNSKIIVSQTQNTGAPYAGWLLYVNASDFLRFEGSNGSAITASTAVPTNQWIHVAAVKESSTTTLYMNGSSVASGTVSITDFSGVLAIGQYTTPVSNAEWNGYISNLRIVKGTAVYTGAFTPPITPLTAITNTSLLTCQSNRFIDNSSSPKTITVNGNTSVVAFSPFAPTQSYSAAAVGGSGYFDGTGDYLTVASNAAFNLSSGAYTVELFVYFLSVPTTVILFNLAGTGTTGYAQLLYSSGALAWQERGTATNQTTYSWTPVTGQWYHIVVGWNGSNSLAFWINGTRVTTNTVTPTGSGQNGVAVGGASDGFNLTGYINSLRIVKGTDVYGVSNTSITVPTAPLTAITNTSLLLNFTNAGVVDATAKNVLETVGNAQISTTQSKWGGGSIAFDGTSTTGLTIPNSSLLTFGSGDWSIEFWIYRVGNSTTQGVFDQRTAAATEIRPLIYINASNQIVYYTNGADRITASLSQNTWVYVAVVKSSGVTRMYIDGTVQATTYTDTNTYLAPTNQTRIGRLIDGFPFNGYIDDFRITLGRARTTTASPTAPFPLQ